MTTRLQYRQQTRRLAKVDDAIDTLAANITASDTSISLTSGNGAGAPQVWEIGSEVIRVQSYASPTGSGLQRGYLGTTAVSASSGDMVRLSPRFPQIDIDKAIESAIRRMNNFGLYRIRTVDLTFNSSVMGYDLESDAVDVYEVRTQKSGSDNDWPIIRSYQVLHDMPMTSFSSGKGIVLYGTGRGQGESGHPIRVRYKARYGYFTDDSTESTDANIGLQDFADDLPAIGAAAELLQTEEIHRTQIDSAEESERAQDVPPRHASSLAAQLDARFRLRCSEVLADLNRTYMPQVRYTG